jgi:hypothetical protein
MDHRMTISQTESKLKSIKREKVTQAKLSVSKLKSIKGRYIIFFS